MAFEVKIKGGLRWTVRTLGSYWLSVCGRSGRPTGPAGRSRSPSSPRRWAAASRSVSRSRLARVCGDLFGPCLMRRGRRAWAHQLIV